LIPKWLCMTDPKIIVRLLRELRNLFSRKQLSYSTWFFVKQFNIYKTFNKSRFKRISIALVNQSVIQLSYVCVGVCVCVSTKHRQGRIRNLAKRRTMASAWSLKEGFGAEPPAGSCPWSGSGMKPHKLKAFVHFYTKEGPTVKVLSDLWYICVWSVYFVTAACRRPPDPIFGQWGGAPMPWSASRHTGISYVFIWSSNLCRRTAIPFT